MKKILLTILAVLAMGGMAVAQTETLLTTITATAKEQASYSTANVATVSFSYTADGSSAYLANWGWWGYGWIATVTPAEGYTITKCIFYDDANRTATDSEAPFVVETTEEDKTPRINGTPIDGGNMWSKGIKKIDVYGYATYSVTLAEGTEDADKWTVKVGEGQAQALPIGGLKGDGSETVTLKYNGRLKVKSVKAVKKAAAPSVPDGAINGKFSVSDTKQVYFSKGNLRYASGAWSFFDNQYDYYNSYSADAWDKFGWSTSATTYGMNTSTDDNTYSGDFVDWGATMGTGWFTLSRFEWAYLFNTRSASTVNGTENGRYAKAKVNDVMGVILFPDTYTHPDGVTAPTGVNETGKTGWNGNSYSSADWTKMEAAGCVFLPAAGSRNGSTVNGEGTNGFYWSATPNSTDAFCVRFYSSGLYPTEYFSRHNGYSVRLVQAVAAQ